MRNDSRFTAYRWLTATIVVLLLGACKGNEIKQEEVPPLEVIQEKAYSRVGYACCNLRYEGELISDSNLAQLPFIAVGTPIKVNRIDGYRADIEVDGKAMQLAHDVGRASESVEQWVEKIVVLDDPKPMLDQYPLHVRRAIEAGKLSRGMSKEQVIMAVGHPQSKANRKRNTSHWRYWWSGFAPYYVYWSGNKLKKIDGHSETVARMTYKSN